MPMPRVMSLVGSFVLAGVVAAQESAGESEPFSLIVGLWCEDCVDAQWANDPIECAPTHRWSWEIGMASCLEGAWDRLRTLEELRAGLRAELARANSAPIAGWVNFGAGAALCDVARTLAALREFGVTEARWGAFPARGPFLSLVPSESLDDTLQRRRDAWREVVVASDAAPIHKGRVAPNKPPEDETVTLVTVDERAVWSTVEAALAEMGRVGRLELLVLAPEELQQFVVDLVVACPERGEEAPRDEGGGSRLEGHTLTWGMGPRVFGDRERVRAETARIVAGAGNQRARVRLKLGKDIVAGDVAETLTVLQEVGIDRVWLGRTELALVQVEREADASVVLPRGVAPRALDDDPRPELTISQNGALSSDGVVLRHGDDDEGVSVAAAMQKLIALPTSRALWVDEGEGKGRVAAPLVIRTDEWADWSHVTAVLGACRERGWFERVELAVVAGEPR